VLQGADGVAFVADSQRHRWDDNIESLQDMHVNLAEHGVDARSLPMVVQYNKQDLPESLVASVSELSASLNFRARPEFAADALRGRGVFDTLRSLGVQVLRRLGAEEGTTAGTRAEQALRTPIGTPSVTPESARAESPGDDIFPMAARRSVAVPSAVSAPALAMAGGIGV
jgi:hypothetical protein